MGVRSIEQRIAEELGVRERPGEGRGRACSTAARPSRSSRATARRPPAASTTRSCARSRSGCATCASSRSGARRARVHREQGKLDDELEAQILAADTKARLEDIYLPLQAEAPHQGADRPRGRSRAARRAACSPTLAWTRRRPPRLRRRRQGRRRRRSRARRRPRHPRRALRRGRRPDRRPARAHVVAGPPHGEGPRRARRSEGAKFADYFDFSEPFTRTAVAPRPRHAPRREGGDPHLTVDPVTAVDDEPVASSRPDGVRAAPSPTGSGSPTTAAPATAGSPTPSAGPGGPGSSSTSASTCGCGCAQAAEDEAVRVFAANLRDLLLAAPAGTRVDDGARPRLPHRRQGRRRRRDRQGRRDRRHLPARAAATSGTSRIATLARLCARSTASS